MFKFDREKIEKKLKEDKEKFEAAKSKKKERDIHSEPILKVAGPGEFEFRAVPYIHNEDFLSDPFPQRYYHFGIPGNGVVYCPKENDGHDCAVCDFVWDRMKEFKGNKPEIDKWRKFLPNKRVWIPGILRGREKEGLKYFSLSTQKDKMSKNHEKLFGWLKGKSTYYMLDPENGFDLILNYESYDAGRSAAMGGAKFGFAGFELSRDETPISDNVEETWAEIEKTMKNVDKDLPRYETKTSEDMLKVMEEWLSSETKRAKSMRENKPVDVKKDDDGVSTDDAVVDDGDKPITVKSEDKPKDQSAEDKKARARAMLSKMK